ncbi:MAG: acetate kinase [Candidatus Atribacteria bacterium]|nr:acetate kinase [Candidatus Atribacteria bacterium]
MLIMAVNSGGSSIKYEVFDIRENSFRSLLKGNLKRLYREDAHLEQKTPDGKTVRKEIPHADHEKGLRFIVEELGSPQSAIQDISALEAVGIKLINAGKEFTSTCLIDQKVIEALQNYSSVTMVHNPPALLAIEIFRKILPQTPLVGVFETSFHRSIPEAHRVYGLPWELCQKHGIEKLGFHGNSHRYIAERIQALTTFSKKVISCHLGSGCSVCAIKDGKSFDISSGFTPQSGTIMSTRPGDFDPQVITFLQEKEGFTPQEIDQLLTRKSGLLAISGKSAEMWELEKLATEEKDKRVELAIEVFVYQVKKYIGAFFALMNGVDALVFTGGIGENAPSIRERIASNLDALGIAIDHEKNQQTVGQERKISSPDSKVEVWVIPTNEELMVAREVYHLSKQQK